MAQTFTMQSLSDVIAFPVKAPRWAEKLLIGVALTLGSMLLIIPGIFVAGYCFRIIRRVLAGGDPELPEWTDWNDLLASGFKLAGAGFVCMLPALAMFVVGYGFLVFTNLATTLMAEHASNAAFVLLIFGMAVFWILFGVGMIFSLLTGIFMPAVLGAVVDRNSFTAIFQPSVWWPVFRANFTGFLISYLLVMGIGFGMNIIFQVLYMSIVLCGLAPIALIICSFYASLIWSVIYAQAYRVGKEKLSVPSELQPNLAQAA